MAYWSADGFVSWSADGKPGWSADGFIPGGFRVMAVAAGYYQGDYKDIGDVFDIVSNNDFSDSTVSQVPVGNPDYPIYGWMLKVSATYPLFSWASSGLSSPRLSPRRTVV